MKTVNEVKNAYTYYLQPKLGKIYSMSKNKKISLDVMKAIIKNYVRPARYGWPVGNKTKLPWFKETVDEISSKKELYFFCLNSVNKAKRTEAR